jgi:hypothetical protein
MQYIKEITLTISRKCNIFANEYAHFLNKMQQFIEKYERLL